VKVVIIGASDNPERYSYKAAEALLNKGFEIVLVGSKNKTVLNHPIQPTIPVMKEESIVTLYVGPLNQNSFIQDILFLNPSKVIFNPGTENPLFQEILDSNNIEWEEACTLVKLSLKQFP
jgi:predicted CoA-binding protein